MAPLCWSKSRLVSHYCTSGVVRMYNGILSCKTLKFLFYECLWGKSGSPLDDHNIRFLPVKPQTQLTRIQNCTSTNWNSAKTFPELKHEWLIRCIWQVSLFQWRHLKSSPGLQRYCGRKWVIFSSDTLCHCVTFVTDSKRPILFFTHREYVER